MAKKKKKKKQKRGKRGPRRFHGPPPESGEFRVPLPPKDEQFGIVIQLLGASTLLVKCQDGLTRQVRIPGKFRKRMWCRVSDLVTIKPWYGMKPDEKADLTNRFRQNQVEWLMRHDHLPEELQL